MFVQPAPQYPTIPNKLPVTGEPPAGVAPTPELPSPPESPLDRTKRHLQIAEYAYATTRRANEVLPAHKAQQIGQLGAIENATEEDALDKNEFAGFALMQAPGHAVVAFRGTKFTSLHNWKANLECQWTGAPPRHSGFERAWQTLKPALDAWLAVHRPTSITLTGHSLGGAIATVAALELARTWSITEVVVFGCPRVGADEFVKAYGVMPRAPALAHSSLASVTTRYVLATDVVARIPWESWGYRHVGRCFYFNWHGESVNAPRALLQRVVAVSDLEEKALPKTGGVLERLGIDFSPKPDPGPVRLYAVGDFLSRILPGWGGWLALPVVIVVGVVVDSLRHLMKGYTKVLKKCIVLNQLPRSSE